MTIVQRATEHAEYVLVARQKLPDDLTPAEFADIVTGVINLVDIPWRTSRAFPTTPVMLRAQYGSDLLLWLTVPTSLTAIVVALTLGVRRLSESARNSAEAERATAEGKRAEAEARLADAQARKVDAETAWIQAQTAGQRETNFRHQLEVGGFRADARRALAEELALHLPLQPGSDDPEVLDHWRRVIAIADGSGTHHDDWQMANALSRAAMILARFSIEPEVRPAEDIERG